MKLKDKINAKRVKNKYKNVCEEYLRIAEGEIIIIFGRCRDMVLGQMFSLTIFWQASIYWKIPPPPPPPPRGRRKKYQLMSFEGKNMKRGREKGGKSKRKRKKGGKEKEKM